MTAQASPPCPSGPVADLLAAIEVVRCQQQLAGACGDPRISVALLRASCALDGLALRELAAVRAYGTAAELGHCSAAALVQATTGGTVQAARNTVRLAECLDTDLGPLGDLLVAGRLTRQHCTAVVHGLRGLGAEVITPALPAICQLALSTDPDRLTSELRLRAEAISPELAAQARRRLDARVGVTADDTPDGTGHLTSTLHPETLALFHSVTDPLVHGQRTDGDTRSASRSRHDALHQILRHAADCTGLDLPQQGGSRAQVTVLATAGTPTGLSGAEPAHLLSNRHGLLTRDELLRLLCDADVSTVHLSPDREQLNLSRLSRTVTRPMARPDRPGPHLRRTRLPPPTRPVPSSPRLALGQRRPLQPGQPGVALSRPPPGSPRHPRHPRHPRPPTPTALHRRPDHDPHRLAPPHHRLTRQPPVDSRPPDSHPPGRHPPDNRLSG